MAFGSIGNSLTSPPVGFTLKSAQAQFFDTKKVMAAVRKAERSRMSKGGAWVRRAAKSMIRKRKRASFPGHPPSSHAGTLRRHIYFAYDPSRRDVSIGPVLLSGKRRSGDGKPVSPSRTTPEVLEYGGRVQIVEYQRDYTPIGRKVVRERWGRDPDAWHRLGKKSLWHKKGQPLRIRKKRTRAITIEPRPFMGPALAKVAPQLPDLWKDSVT